jgi:ribosomal protein L11 methyltransferase
MPDKLHDKADLLVGNILLSTLISLKERFHELLNKNGTLIASGLLADQPEQLIKNYSDLFVHQGTIFLDEWALVEFKAR